MGNHFSCEEKYFIRIFANFEFFFMNMEIATNFKAVWFRITYSQSIG